MQNKIPSVIISQLFRYNSCKFACKLNISLYDIEMIQIIVSFFTCLKFGTMSEQRSKFIAANEKSIKNKEDN